KLSATDLKSLLSPSEAEGLKKETIATLYAKLAVTEPTAHRKLLMELMTSSVNAVEELKKKHECPICRQKEVDCVFGCGHTACRGCADEITECHICKARLRRRSPVHLPY
ncbi:E3 ubiquitin-protein ligase RGLG2-like protein, partial [Aphelenchoides avenae]